jgi:transketolase
VEHLAAARLIPNLTVIRPADAEETREAWLAAIANNGGPTALLLTRQDVPVLPQESDGAGRLQRGAYTLWESRKSPDILLLASGSEVHITLDAAKELESKGIGSRVISFPSWELFEKQSAEYRGSVLPDTVPRRAVIEAGRSMGWERYAGAGALFITLERFGASAPAHVLALKFGFSTENIVARVTEYLKG